jgi:hypothetical protein
VQLGTAPSPEGRVAVRGRHEGQAAPNLRQLGDGLAVTLALGCLSL